MVVSLVYSGSYDPRTGGVQLLVNTAPRQDHDAVRLVSVTPSGQYICNSVIIIIITLTMIWSSYIIRLYRSLKKHYYAYYLQ